MFCLTVIGLTILRGSGCDRQGQGDKSFASTGTHAAHHKPPLCHAAAPNQDGQHAALQAAHTLPGEPPLRFARTTKVLASMGPENILPFKLLTPSQTRFLLPFEVFITGLTKVPAMRAPKYYGIL